MTRNISQALLMIVATVALISSTATAQEAAVYQASDQSFSVRLPGSFEPAASPPNGTVLAVEVPNTGMSLFCSKSEAVELDDKIFRDKMKQNLFDGGAQIYGKAKAPLAGESAASFLVGGIVNGKESLFVFNKRPDAVFTFVLNYPVGQRAQAAKVWNKIAPTFKFRKPAAKSGKA